MKAVIPFLVAVLIVEVTSQAALYVRKDAVIKEKQLSRVSRQASNADQMVQNILQWIQEVYNSKSRKARQGTLRDYLPPSNTQRPRPFQPQTQIPTGSDQVFTGYPYPGTNPQPAFEEKPIYTTPESRPTENPEENGIFSGYPSGPQFTSKTTTMIYTNPTTEYPQGPTTTNRYQTTKYTTTAQPQTGYPGGGYPGPSTDYQRPTTGYPGPSTGYPGPSTGYPGPSTGYPGPSTGYPGPSTGYPGPSTGYPGPSTGFPGPSTGYPGPSTGYPKPTTGYPGPSTGYPGPSTGYPGPSTGYPGPSTGYPGPSTGFPGPSTGYPGPTTGFPGPSTGYPTTTTEGYRPEYPGPSTSYPSKPTTGGYKPTYPGISTVRPDNEGGESENNGNYRPGEQPDDDDSKHPPHIHAIDVQCAKDMMTINLEFNRPYNGIIYSKGYYNNPECRYVSENSNQIKFQFTLRLDSCGTEFVNAFDTQGQSYLENVLVLQNEPSIQEVWDTIRSVRCLWEGNLNKALSVALSVGMLAQEIVTFSGDTAMARLDIQLGRGPFAPPANGLVKIGDTMTLVVSVTGDPGFDIQVKDCRAHDADDRISVLLTDEDGCVLKPKVFGAFQKTRNTGNTGASIIAYAFFSAFKFPDAMDLVLECNVELCKTDCEVCPEPNQGIEPGAKRRRRSISNETAIGEPVKVKRTLMVVLPEDISDASLLAPQDSGVCLSTNAFVLSSVLILSLLATSSLFSAYLWLRLQRTYKI